MHSLHKTKKLATGIAVALAGLSSHTALAQDMFTVSGPISYGYYYDYSGSGNFIYLNGGSYEATVNHDSSTPLSYTYTDESNYYFDVYANSGWDDAVESIDYKVYDTDGNLVLEYTTNANDASNYYDYNQVSRGAYDYSDAYCSSCSSYGYEQWYQDKIGYTDDTIVDEYSYVIERNQDISDISDTIANITTYPSLLDNENWTSSSTYLFVERYDYFDDYYSGYWYISGTIADRSAGIVDTDSDGILDPDDACVESDLSTTVVVDDEDTGVANSLQASGCTITDTLALIRADEEKHGKVVSGVSHYLNFLKDDGIISGREKGKIQSAIAGTNGKSEESKGKGKK